MGELARSMGVTGGALTSLVNRLIRNGYLRRKSPRGDRRFSLVSLSPKGRKRLEALNEKMKTLYSDALDILPDAERSAFLQSFDRVVSNLSALGNRRKKFAGTSGSSRRSS